MYDTLLHINICKAYENLITFSNFDVILGALLGVGLDLLVLLQPNLP